MSKFYICGLLGALNSRYALRREMNSQDTQGRVNLICHPHPTASLTLLELVPGQVEPPHPSNCSYRHGDLHRGERICFLLSRDESRLKTISHTGSALSASASTALSATTTTSSTRRTARRTWRCPTWTGHRLGSSTTSTMPAVPCSPREAMSITECICKVVSEFS
jgi:hypothetical protein